MEEGLHRAGAVHPGGLVELPGDVLQHAGELEQRIGHADPDVDDDDRHPGPGGIGEEGQALTGGQEAQLPQQHVDRALWLEHGAHDQQGDEHGHRAGENEAEPPEALCLGVLAVDGDGQDHAREVVGEGGEEGPHQGPHQHGAESTAQDAAGVKEGGEVVKTHPVEEDQMIVDLAVVGEGHADHKDQGQDGQDGDEHHGRHHEEPVDVLVQQRAQVLPEIAHVLAQL